MKWLDRWIDKHESQPSQMDIDKAIANMPQDVQVLIDIDRNLEMLVRQMPTTRMIAWGVFWGGLLWIFVPIALFLLVSSIGLMGLGQ